MRARTLALMLLLCLCLPVLPSAGSAAAAGQTVIRVSAGVGLKDALSAIFADFGFTPLSAPLIP